MNNYYNKYLKYKTKYLKLKGGVQQEIPINITNIVRMIIGVDTDDDIIEMLNAVGNEHINDRSNDPPGNTVLIAATKNEDRNRVLQHILHNIRNIDTNIGNDNNETALIVAAQYANVDAVQLILAHSGPLEQCIHLMNITDNTGRKAQDWVRTMYRDISYNPYFQLNAFYQTVNLMGVAHRGQWPNHYIDVLHGRGRAGIQIIKNKYDTIYKIIDDFRNPPQSDDTLGDY